MALLHALKVSNHLQPPYTATVLVELYATKEGNTSTTHYAVNVTYKNETDHEPYPLHIPGTSLGRDIIIFNGDMECEWVLHTM